jgi:hypothetical protein
MRKYADIDLSRYPLVYIVINPISPTIQEQEVFLNEFSQIFSMPNTAMVVFNGRHQKWISKEAQRHSLQWISLMEDQIRRKVKVIVFTECSSWVYLLLKIVLSVTTASVPMHVTKTFDDAIVLLKEKYMYQKMDQPDLSVCVMD